MQVQSDLLTFPSSTTPVEPGQLMGGLNWLVKLIFTVLCQDGAATWAVCCLWISFGEGALTLPSMKPS